MVFSYTILLPVIKSFICTHYVVYIVGSKTIQYTVCFTFSVLVFTSIIIIMHCMLYMLTSILRLQGYLFL